MPYVQYRGLTLDRFQADAIAALEQGSDVLVCAPTGTGKTVVADWLVESTLEAGHEVVYTAPIKALSNQKYRDYCRLLGEDKTGLVTGDLVIRRNAPCRVMTTEILRNMLLSGEPLPHLRTVIVDEIHFLADFERGTVWEEVLIYLPPEVQVVGLSATLANLDEFAAWLEHVRGRPITVIEEYKRAVPLEFALATREGGLRDPRDMKSWFRHWQRKAGATAVRHESRRQRRQDRQGRGRRGDRGRDKLGHPTRHTDVFSMLAPDQVPYLYFVFSRRDTELLAFSLGQRMQRSDRSLLNDRERRELARRLDEFVRTPGAEYALDDDTRRLYEEGIAFHHAGLHVMLKALVEELYESKLVKVLYCTSTFALGINMPARAAVFDSLFRYDGKQLIPLPAREFMQMAGRAGRRGMDDAGLVVIRTDIDDYPRLEQQLDHYLSGRTEPVLSRFSLSFNSVVNLLEQHPPQRIRTIVEKSFLSFTRARKSERDQSRADTLEAELADMGWTVGDPIPPSLRAKAKELRRTKNRAETGGDRTWEEFVDKVRFLEAWGYISRPSSDDLEGVELNAGAKVLKSIQIQEIFTTECFLEGIFEDLDPTALFGVLTAMCYELPRGTQVRLDREQRELVKEITRIRISEIVTSAEALTQVTVTWDPEVIAFGRMWAAGHPLNEILLNVQASSDISGHLVGAFRRAKDLAGQLMEVYADDPAKKGLLRDLIRTVTRDEVEVVD